MDPIDTLTMKKRQARTFWLCYQLKALGSSAAQPFLGLSSNLMFVAIKVLINNTTADESYDVMTELVGTVTKATHDTDKIPAPLLNTICGVLQVYSCHVCARTFNTFDVLCHMHTHTHSRGKHTLSLSLSLSHTHTGYAVGSETKPSAVESL
jgi:hypothetical protein